MNSRRGWAVALTIVAESAGIGPIANSAWHSIIDVPPGYYDFKKVLRCEFLLSSREARKGPEYAIPVDDRSLALLQNLTISLEGDPIIQALLTQNGLYFVTNTVEHGATPMLRALQKFSGWMRIYGDQITPSNELGLWDAEGLNKIAAALVGTPYELPFEFRNFKGLHSHLPSEANLYDHINLARLGQVAWGLELLFLHDRSSAHKVGAYLMVKDVFRAFQSRLNFVWDLKALLAPYFSEPDLERIFFPLVGYLSLVWDGTTNEAALVLGEADQNPPELWRQYARLAGGSLPARERRLKIPAENNNPHILAELYGIYLNDEMAMKITDRFSSVLGSQDLWVEASPFSEAKILGKSAGPGAGWVQFYYKPINSARDVTDRLIQALAGEGKLTIELQQMIKQFGRRTPFPVYSDEHLQKLAAEKLAAVTDQVLIQATLERLEALHLLPPQEIVPRVSGRLTNRSRHR